MDELDLLKKDWKRQESSYPTLNYEDIYKLIHKKSSSIVKWIFIICILEFMFWGFLNLIIPDSYLEIYEQFHLKKFMFITQGIHYAIVLYFIFLFYKNFKAISIIDNTNLLMKKILRTRKNVNYYVYYNIILYVVLSIVLNIIMFSQPEVLLETFLPENTTAENGKFISILLIVQVITLLLVCGLLWLYYRIIYGILLSKLKKNYKELETLEF